MLGKCNNITHNTYRGERNNEETFEYKGCWNCLHFEYDKIFPYLDVEQASKVYKVSKSIIRNWIRSSKLDGKLFIMREPKFVWGSRKKYFVKKCEVI